jgi:hypothetical protein
VVIFFEFFFFKTEFWATSELDCEHMSLQLMAPGLITANAGTSSGLLLVNFVSFNWVLNWPSAWLWACKLTAQGPGLAHSHCLVSAMISSLLIVFFSQEFSGDYQLVCELVSSQLMALGLLTATAGTSSGLFVVKFTFFNWVLSNQRAWMWACELIAYGPRLARSHCRYRQCIFPCNLFFSHVSFEMTISFIVSM